MRTPTLVIATLLVAGAFVAAPTAAASATCETAEPVAASSSRTGVAAPGTSRWYHHLAAGDASYTLTPAAGTDVDLYVWDEHCSTILCWSIEENSATDSCSVSGGANYRVQVEHFDGAGGYTISFSGSPLTECSDGVDNDADGSVDYPSDPGCASPTDSSEGPTCPQVDPSVVLCLEPTSVILEQPVTLVGVGSGSDHVAGYLDVYRFTVLGVTTTLPCVTLRVGGGEVSPCAAAGGTFVSRSAELARQPEPEIQPLPVATVRVCAAELTATAFGFGVQSAPAYALC